MLENRKFIKPRYVDSRQSLQTSNRMTTDSREQLEQSKHHQRLKRTTRRPQRLIEIMN